MRSIMESQLNRYAKELEAIAKKQRQLLGKILYITEKALISGRRWKK